MFRGRGAVPFETEKGQGNLPFFRLWCAVWVAGPQRP